MDGEHAGKLLLVEDEHLLRGLIAQFLRAEGFEVVEAADGPRASNFFASSGPFDVVLLDLNLPMLSGVDVCRRIKGMNPLQPVIICSAAILDSHADALRSDRRSVSEQALPSRGAPESNRRRARPQARGSVQTFELRPLKSPHWKVDGRKPGPPAPSLWSSHRRWIKVSGLWCR